MAAGTIADRSKAGTGANKVIVESGTRRRIDRIYGRQVNATAESTTSSVTINKAASGRRFDR
jgi:hypothetical protein